MESISSLFGKGSIKSEIINVVSPSSPQNAKKIFSSIVKRGIVKATYQGVHKAVRQLAESGVVSQKGEGYALSEKWVSELYSDARKAAMRIAHTPSTAISRVSTYDSPHEYYKILLEMMKQPGEFRISSQTPALIISSEAQSSAFRKKYFEKLYRGVMDGSIRGKYLFSTEMTRQMIIDERDKEALGRLKALEDLANFELRHAPLHTVIPGAISAHDALIPYPSPHHTDIVGFIRISAEDTSKFARIYDNVFLNALPLYTFIKQVESEMRRLR